MRCGRQIGASIWKSAVRHSSNKRHTLMALDHPPRARWADPSDEACQVDPQGKFIVRLKLLLIMLVLTGNHLAMASDVVLLGDEARLTLTGYPNTDAPARDASAAEVADMIAKARHAIFVVDAANGPMQVTREHIIIARQARIPSLSMLLVNTEAVDQSALIQQVITEMRELFDAYDTDGSAVPLFIGKQGLNAALGKVAALPRREPEHLDSTMHNEIAGFIYLLSKPESPATMVLGNGEPVTIWLGGQTVQVRGKAEPALQPGDSKPIRLITEAPVTAGPGQRFLLQSQGRIIAAGVVAE